MKISAMRIALAPGCPIAARASSWRVERSASQIAGRAIGQPLLILNAGSERDIDTDFATLVAGRGWWRWSAKGGRDVAKGRVEVRSETLYTTAMIATAIPAAIRPYSMAVAPDSLRRKSPSCFMIDLRGRAPDTGNTGDG